MFDRSAATGPNAELYSFGCRCVGDLSQRHYPGTSRLVKSREPVLIPRPLSQRFYLDYSVFVCAGDGASGINRVRNIDTEGIV